MATTSMMRRAAASAAKSFTSIRPFSSTTDFNRAELPTLSYEYDALEPVITGEIMELHHAKHHQAYVNNFNKAADEHREEIQKEDKSLQTLAQLNDVMLFNLGGHINHQLFWETFIRPADFQPPKGMLKASIEENFGSVDDMVREMIQKGTGVQGSGWVWLGYHLPSDKMYIHTTPNQETLERSGLKPLLGIDVWEHAYYLQYKNRRPEYLKEIWKVVDWGVVAERHASFKPEDVTSEGTSEEEKEAK